MVMAALAFGCGGQARMPKGPPPEYEEHDAGTPTFEGDGPSKDSAAGPPVREVGVPTATGAIDAGEAH
jgi:hypothetical protein